MPETTVTQTNNESSSPTKGSPTKKDIDTATTALNHFARGKRHLLVNDINSAVNSLQEASRLLGEHYGETAPECGDAYFYYGRALLELSRIESGVLGNALDGEDGSTEGSSEGEEDKEDEEEGGEGEEAEAEAEGGEEGSAPDGDGEASSQEGDKTAEEEDEVSNIQLAWEMLELSKVIFQKQEELPGMALKVAQVHLKLGEVSLEGENYPQSIEDFKHCLTIQKSNLEADNRCLAETFYQLGVAHSFSDDFDNAIENFRSAANVIDTRIVNLKDIKATKEKFTEEERIQAAAKAEDPFYTEQGEIDELNKILPEMKEKIADMEQMRTDSKEKLQKLAKEAAPLAKALGFTKSTSQESSSSSSGGFDAPSSSSTSNGAKPISNIGHLVRKKRKPEEEAVPEDAKKVKGEDGEPKPVSVVNGEPKPVSVVNGTDKKEDDKSDIKEKEADKPVNKSDVDMKEKEAEKPVNKSDNVDNKEKEADKSVNKSESEAMETDSTEKNEKSNETESTKSKDKSESTEKKGDKTKPIVESEPKKAEKKCEVKEKTTDATEKTEEKMETDKPAKEEEKVTENKSIENGKAEKEDKTEKNGEKEPETKAEVTVKNGDAMDTDKSMKTDETDAKKSNESSKNGDAEKKGDNKSTENGDASPEKMDTDEITPSTEELKKIAKETVEKSEESKKTAST